MVEHMEGARPLARTEDVSTINLLALTTSDYLNATGKNSVPDDFCQSFAYTLVQAPLDGVAQLVDGQTNGKTKQAVHFLDAPEAAPFGSANWAAQQTGSALGAIAPIVAIHRGVSLGLSRNYSMRSALVMSEHVQALTTQQALTARSAKTLEAALTGAIYGGIFSPTGSEQTDLLSARARAGASMSISFATLTASTLALKALGERSALSSMPSLSAPLRSEIFIGVASGVPAGLVSANVDSLLHGQGLASPEQQLQSVLTFAITNTGCAYAKGLIAELRPSQRTTASTGQFKSIGMDVDGRPIAEGNRARVTSKWADYSPADMMRSRSHTLANMTEIKALEPGKTVLDQFRDSGLSIAQKYRVLNSLAQVQNYLADQEVNLQIDGEQHAKWIGKEQGRVMDAAKVGKFTAIETEDALLTSMFSEACKTDDMFFKHSFDGAIAADHTLAREHGAGFTRTRLDGIVHAIREQQLGPPEVMAFLYARRIKVLMKTPLEQSQETALKSLIAKIADPLNCEKNITSDGGTALKLTVAENAMLRHAGIKYWEVPDEANPWNRVSRAVSDNVANARNPFLNAYMRQYPQSPPENRIEWEPAPPNAKDIRLEPPWKDFEQKHSTDGTSLD